MSWRSSTSAIDIGRRTRGFHSDRRTCWIERLPKRESFRCGAMGMEMIDPVHCLAPVWLVLAVDPPRHITRPGAAVKPIPALGESLAVYAVVCERCDRFKVTP